MAGNYSVHGAVGNQPLKLKTEISNGKKKEKKKKRRAGLIEFKCEFLCVQLGKTHENDGDSVGGNNRSW